MTVTPAACCGGGGSSDDRGCGGGRRCSRLASGKGLAAAVAAGPFAIGFRARFGDSGLKATLGMGRQPVGIKGGQATLLERGTMF